MSLHVRQIIEYLEKNIFPFIQLTTDEVNKSEEKIYNIKLSRSLVALSIQMQDDISIEKSCNNITDGFHDNGIDGIYYAESSKTLFLIQSKFHKDGNGTIDAGESHKFIQGVKDLVNARFDKFNSKIKNRENEIEKYLLDTQTKFVLIPIYTGKQELSPEVFPIFNEYVEEANDLSDTFSLLPINLWELYTLLTHPRKDI